MKILSVLTAAAVALVLTVSSANAQEESWVDRIKFKGDVRLRHERFDVDGEEDRARTRFRTRFGFSAKVSDDVKFVLRLATGGNSPVSTNQTFGDGFSTKDIGVDLAYIDWKINDTMNFYGGKMKNPMYKAGGAPVIWDGDLNLEGFAATFAQGNFFGTVGGFSAEERGSSDDSLLYVAQAGLKVPLGDTAKLTAGVGYIAYTNTIGNSPFYNGSAKGNSVDLNGDYIHDYKNTELFAELSTNLGDWPFKVYAHATQNNEVSAEDTAYAVGAKLGSAKKDGETEFSWTYMDIEADSVIGTYSDSDFGDGNTGTDGHMLKAKYAVSEKIFIGGTLFLNNVDRLLGAERDYNRLQLDVEFMFN